MEPLTVSSEEAEDTVCADNNKNYPRPDYMSNKYKGNKEEFDRSLEEFDVSLFTFDSWSKIKNKYIKQYLIIDYVKRIYTERRYNMRHSTKLYSFIQSGINSKAIKPNDIEFKDNTICNISSLVVVSPVEFILTPSAQHEKASSAKIKLPLISRLWTKTKTTNSKS